MHRLRGRDVTIYRASNFGVRVELTRFEMEHAAWIGARRRIESLCSGRGEAHGYKGLGWSENIEGAMGELALAKVKDRFWSGSINTYQAGGDVGRKVQVRTMSQDHFGLLVRQVDADDKPYVLVVGVAPKYRVVGWMWGKDAKKDIWQQDFSNGRPPTYCVPQEELTPITPRAPR